MLLAPEILTGYAQTDDGSGKKSHCRLSDKFDVDLSLTLDKEGFIKSLGVEYDIEASMEKEQLPYVGESNASITLAGEVNASFKYNDAVSLVFPNDLDTYVLFEF